MPLLFHRSAASAKVVWMVLRIHPQAAKVLYGLLQAGPGGSQFTYADLSGRTNLGRNTLKRAVAHLVDAGWLRVSQRSRKSPIRFTLGSPALRRAQAEAARAGRRLQRARYKGEALMQEYLSLLIDSDNFTDNARPGFLVNPLTDERLELDRYYTAAGVAFEFHGSQHSHASGRFTQQAVDAQVLRDLLKAGLCKYRDIDLIIVRANDLSLTGMTRKVGQSLPLRNLAGHEPLIDLLEEASLTYQASARKPTA